MNCQKAKRSISRWVDGELEGKEGRNLAAHIEACAFCRKEAAVFQSLNRALQSPRENIQVSPGFEMVFWKKVSERRRTGWFARLISDLEGLMPMPSLRQAVAFVLLAFFLGNIGGFASTLGQGALGAEPLASIQHFSNVQGFKGISSNSMAASYMKTIEKEVFE